MTDLIPVITTPDIISFFREKTFYPNQREILLQIQDAFRAGKRFVILEAGTGTGKSVLLRTVAEWLGSAHICTVQKSLQEQYTRYENPKIPTVEGRSGQYCLQDMKAKQALSKFAVDLSKVDRCSNGHCIQDSHFFCDYKPSRQNKINEFIKTFYTEENHPKVKKALRELGLNENSTPDQIKDAFRKMAMLYHPDHGGNPEEFIAKNALFETAQSADTIKTPIKVRPSNFACNSTSRGDLYWNSTDHCPYWQQKVNAINSPLTVHNYSYFLTETNNVGDFGMRKLLGCDEAHNLKKVLSSFVGFSLDINNLYKAKIVADEIVGGGQFIQFANFGKDLPKWVSFLKECLDYFEKVTTAVEAEYELIGNISSSEKEKNELTESYNALKEIVETLNRFITEYNTDPKNWVMNINYKGTIVKSIEIKPIHVNIYAEKYLFKYGEKVLLMSATIPDPIKFCNNLGIPLKDVRYISVPTPFDPERAPIYPLNVGKFNNQNIEVHIDKIVKSIEQVLDLHFDQKGIIHCISGKNRNLILEKINPKYKSRLLVPTATNKKEIIKLHLQSSTPTTLLSISDTEGLDLVGDTGRFNYLVSFPFASLGDAQVKANHEEDPVGYNIDMLISLIQAAGRCNRNSDDYSFMYIAPSSFGYYIEKVFHPMFSEMPFYPASFASLRNRIKWDREGLGRKTI